MSAFLGPFLTMFMSVGLAALIARWVVKHLTPLPPKPIAFALALGVYIGRGQVAAEVGDLESAGSGAGGLVVLALLWFLWFKKTLHEPENG